MFVATNNPVRDAEAIQEEQEGRPYIACDICHGPIYYGNGDYCSDDVYNIDGLRICEGCIQDYIKNFKKELVW